MAAGVDRGRVLLGLMLTMALAAMDQTIVATAIPSIVHDLGGFSLFPWVFSVYLLMYAVTIPIYGKLADLRGRKPVLTVGTAIFLAGSILSGLSWSMVPLIVFRGIQGIGAGAIMPITSTIAGDLYSVEERGRVQGYLASVWGIAAVVGPAIGGFFAEYLTWRWIFYINLPIGGVAMLMVWRHLHERVERRPHRIDVGGALTLLLGMGFLIFGLLEGGVRWAWASPQSVLVLGAGLALVVAFAAWERRAAEPVLPPWVFGSRMLSGANLGSMAIGLIVIGLSSFLPLFAQGVLGTGAVAAGFALAAMSVGWPLASGQSARLYLRIGFRRTAQIGALITIAAGVLFALLGPASPVWQAGAASFVMGAGLGFGSTALVVGVQSVVGWNRRGVVTGANMFTRMLGSTAGAAVFGSVVNSTLASWFANPPASLASRLPRSLNAASLLLGGRTGIGDPAVAAFVRRGLFVGVHRVFLGIVGVGVLTLLVELLMPRRAEPLDEAARTDIAAEQAPRADAGPVGAEEAAEAETDGGGQPAPAP